MLLCTIMNLCDINGGHSTTHALFLGTTEKLLYVLILECLFNTEVNLFFQRVPTCGQLLQ